jgi:hypothetical protein
MTTLTETYRVPAEPTGQPDPGPDLALA